MSFRDEIVNAANKQLDKTSKAVADGAWFDTLMGSLQAEAAKLPTTEAKTAANVTLSSLILNKDKFVGLGESAFALFVDKLASGDEQEAASLYLRAVGSADAIIEAMEQGTLGVIDAKRRIDQMWADAWSVVKSVAITGAKILLPLLLAAI